MSPEPSALACEHCGASADPGTASVVTISRAGGRPVAFCADTPACAEAAAQFITINAHRLSVVIKPEETKP